MFNIKKRFFEKQIKLTKAAMWADEFAIEASRKEREVVRQQLNNAKSALHAVEEKMQKNPKDKQLALDGQLIQRKTEYLQKTLDDIDAIIGGKEPAPDEPYTEPQQGLMDSLESKRRKLQRLEDFIKEHC